MRLSPYSTVNSMDPYQETQATYDYLTTELDRLGLLYLHLVEPADREHEEGRQVLKKNRTNFRNVLLVNGGYTSRQAAQVVAEGSADRSEERRVGKESVRTGR